MSEENSKFVEEMLKRAKEKKETKAQTRTEGVDKEEIEKMTKKFVKEGKLSD
jgi:polyhydroxyalkanoate synthesis regulator phasin